MNTVRSKDGTTIAYDQIGGGPAVILVDGGLCSRALGPSGPLAKLLAQNFTVFTYDRRGRGDSGDTAPYAVEREVEDIAALLTRAGGAAYVWGISSGAVLALEAANRLAGITKLALYEAPFIVDGSRPPVSPDDDARIAAAIAAGHRSEAVQLFLKAVGVPAVFVTLMRLLPVWSKLKAVAHTLPYDGAIVQAYQRGAPLPVGRWLSVTMPTLLMAGGKSPAWVHHAMKALADVLPHTQYRTLERQTHNVSAKALAPVLKEFFGRDR
jgi:pimeloyl-ACP methyl ester carboxylesterase